MAAGSARRRAAQSAPIQVGSWGSVSEARGEVGIDPDPGESGEGVGRVGGIRVSVGWGLSECVGGRLGRGVGRPVRAAEASWATWPSERGVALPFFCFVFIYLHFCF